MTAETDPPDYNPEATWEGPGLAAALRAFQAELPQVKKEATAQYGKYADLAPVSRAIIPELARHGLTWLCKPMRADGEFVLRYKLTHVASGEVEEGDYPLHLGAAPAQGSDITYARRYCLLAVTGVAPDGDDDDGQGAPKAKARPKPQARAEANGHGQPSKQPGSAKTNQPGLITSIQIKYQDLGFKRTERDDMLRASEQIIGRELTGPNEGRTHNNLSEVEARKLRDTIGGYEDRGDLLAALVEAATP